jgi:hypothetical protein
MDIATRNMLTMPLIISNRKCASAVPNRRPVPTRIEFLLSLSLPLCVRQSTVAGMGRTNIRGR